MNRGGAAAAAASSPSAAAAAAESPVAVGQHAELPSAMVGGPNNFLDELNDLLRDRVPSPSAALAAVAAATTTVQSSERLLPEHILKSVLPKEFISSLVLEVSQKHSGRQPDVHL